MHSNSIVSTSCLLTCEEYQIWPTLLTWHSPLVSFAGNSDLLSAAILQHATLLGLKLEGAIPIAHSGFFSFLHGKRELWIFRGLPPFAPGLISP